MGQTSIQNGNGVFLFCSFEKFQLILSSIANDHFRCLYTHYGPSGESGILGVRDSLFHVLLCDGLGLPSNPRLVSKVGPSR